MMDVISMGAISAAGSEKDAQIVAHAATRAATAGHFSNPNLAGTPFCQGVLPDGLARDARTLAIHAIEAAFADHSGPVDRAGTALVLATGAGDLGELEAGVQSAQPYALAEQVAQATGLGGVFTTVSNACASAGYALRVAADLLDRGQQQVIVCGVEAKSDTSQATFKSLLALDPQGCRPFDENRGGTVLSAGAAALLLTRPGVHPMPRARVAGLATTCDAYHETAPDPDGTELRRAMLAALNAASLNTDDIVVFVPHATGTRLNDEIEAEALAALFPEEFSPGTAVLLKREIGHSCGASAAFSVIAAVRSLETQAMAPAGDDTDQKRDPVPGHALVNAAAFGGNNVSVVISPSGAAG